MLSLVVFLIRLPQQLLCFRSGPFMQLPVEEKILAFHFPLKDNDSSFAV